MRLPLRTITAVFTLSLAWPPLIRPHRPWQRLPHRRQPAQQPRFISTFTTANASAVATGHTLGDTGDFSNTIDAGFEVPGVGSSLTPFLESDVVLGDVDEHFSGNYLE